MKTESEPKVERVAEKDPGFTPVDFNNKYLGGNKHMYDVVRCLVNAQMFNEPEWIGIAARKCAYIYQAYLEGVPGGDSDND
jgi:hypothetical protein